MWACVRLFSRPETAHLTGLPDESLAATFDSDMRNVVYRWSETDPRSERDRKRATFDFVYQTYDSSAWIPQSLFEGTWSCRPSLGDVDTIVRDKVGLVLWRNNPRVVAFGMAPSRSADKPLMSGRSIAWSVTPRRSTACAYLGAGTKVFDDKMLGDALKLLTRPAGRHIGSSGLAGPIHSRARRYDILSSHHHDKIDSLTRARSTAFAASHVEMYMRPARRRDACRGGRRDEAT